MVSVLLVSGLFILFYFPAGGTIQETILSSSPTVYLYSCFSLFISPPSLLVLFCLSCLSVLIGLYTGASGVVFVLYILLFISPFKLFQVGVF
jgi:hypothetical protein